MDNDNDRTVVRSSHTHRPHIPAEGAGQSQGVNALPIGTRLGEFEITGLIGEGGFGIVYLAYDHSLDRQVALKEYMPSGMASRTQAMQVTVRSRHYVDTFTMGLKSFVNEARLLARFDSPSLVKVYRFWEENGTAYMVMPYYDGITLKQALKDRNIVPDEEWLRAILAHLLDAIDTIHQVQCYHRDIAPDNILILKDGRPLLLDFGAARRVIGDLTQGLTVILKPGFAPIEQYADIPGTRQGPWTDIYALAAVVYFAITGKSPPPSVARIVNDEMVPAREVGRGRYSEQFLAVLDQALAVKPDQRIQSVAEFRDALDLDEGIPRTMPELGGGMVYPGSAASGQGAPRTGPPRRTRSGMPPADDGEDWLHTMVADQRPPPPEKKKSKTGVVLAGLMLCAGIGAAVVGYRWMIPAETEDAPLADSSDATAFDNLSDDSGTSGSGAFGGNIVNPSVPSTTDIVKSPPPAPPVAPPAAPSVSPPPPVLALNKRMPMPEEKPVQENTPKAVAAPPAAPALSVEDESWRAATAKDTPAAYKDYLKKYPKGKHAAAAQVMLDSKHTKIAAVETESTSAQTQPKTQDVPSQAKSNDGPAPNADTDSVAKPAGENDTIARAQTEAQPKPESKVLPAEPESKEATPAAPSSSPPAVAAGSVTSTPESTPRAPETNTPQLALKTPAPEPSAIDSLKNEAAKPEPSAAATPSSAPSAGQRTIKLPGQTMIGNFSPDPATGIVSGTGQIKWDNGDRFEGKLVKGSKEGKGQFTWANGQRYNGDWAGDVPNGRGVLHFANGNRYEGEVRNGEPHGQGSIRFRSGDVYTGGWVNGKHHGNGKYTWANGTYWEGEFRDGKKTENGKTVFADGRTYAGSSVTAGGASMPNEDGSNQQVMGTSGK